jgi:hypothetical protein
LLRGGYAATLYRGDVHALGGELARIRFHLREARD